jgi:hypothetical protein
MKKILLFLIISTSLMACSTPATTTETASTTTSTANKAELETKLKGMEAAWNLSKMDKDFGVKIVEETVSDDFSSYNDKGLKQTKADIIKALSETKGTISEVINGDMSLTFYGDNVASIVGSHVTKGKDITGKAYTSKTSWTDVFMERNGKWQCIASGGSTAP